MTTATATVLGTHSEVRKLRTVMVHRRETCPIVRDA